MGSSTDRGARPKGQGAGAGHLARPAAGRLRLPSDSAPDDARSLDGGSDPARRLRPCSQRHQGGS
eukprot:15442249-Alexandrium_andersonii.AAC.1